MGSLACRAAELKAILENATYGLEALEALIDDLETRLTAVRAGYLDNLNNALLLKLPMERITFKSSSSVAAGATRYVAPLKSFGAGTDYAAEGTAGIGVKITHAGTLKNLVCQSGAAAGAGESYVFTVRKNGVATALTVTISGDTEQKDYDATNTVTVAIGDRITLELVTSGGATATNHAAAFEFEGA